MIDKRHFLSKIIRKYELGEIDRMKLMESIPINLLPTQLSTPLFLLNVTLFYRLFYNIRPNACLLN